MIAMRYENYNKSYKYCNKSYEYYNTSWLQNIDDWIFETFWSYFLFTCSTDNKHLAKTWTHIK
jgi:hypothetical protein